MSNSPATPSYLQLFHESVATWFTDRYPAATEVQQAAWPVIARGEHVLATAPTGSGKTLTAFLWALSEFATHPERLGVTRVLYISPLKALNNDVKRNLTDPLAELNAGYSYPDLHVATRSGDTPQSERQRLLRKPPEILITTPESLSLMLTSQRSRQTLSLVDTVIVDEIHSLVDNRRGTGLMVSLERLAAITEGYQRIALSATVSPLEAVANYVGGYTSAGQPRPVNVVNTPGEKRINFSVRFPEEARNAAEQGEKIWEPLSRHFKTELEHNKATLFFTNSRRLAEKITLKLNQHEQQPLAYAHHGSLSREVRTEVEQRLKQGEMKAIVATNSLEMGIDIGHLDEVVMVQSPPSVAAGLQRIGRAGHQVGAVSRGTLYPTHAQDFVEAAALSQAIAQKNIEPQKLMLAPLDMLAQIIVSTTASEPWSCDDLFDTIRQATPYRQLTRENFDRVIDMLSGRYAGSRIRELKPRLEHDRARNTVQANRGALLAYYNSGGSIPDRGYFRLQHLDTGTTLGELDEEFVWEATTGDRFYFGSRQWQIHRITHSDVVVKPATSGTAIPPFWRAENLQRSWHFSKQIGDYLTHTNTLLTQGDEQNIVRELTAQRGFDEPAAQELLDYLKRQRQHTNSDLPSADHLLLEHINAGPAGYRGPDDPQQMVIHTFWGGRLNQPFALMLKQAWLNLTGIKLDIHADNNAVVMQVKGPVDPHQIMALVNPANMFELLRQSLERSGFFGARFRECAGRALLLSKQKFNQRQPLWMSRMQAKKLLEQTLHLEEFPILLETWRTCLDDEFDLPALEDRLAELENGTLRWSHVNTRTPSPFAHNLTFGQVSRYMYADDTPEHDGTSDLSGDVIRQALANQQLRPSLSKQVIEQFEQKRQRLQPGYTPQDDEEWQDWIYERVLTPVEELPNHVATLPLILQTSTPDGRSWYLHQDHARHLVSIGLLSNLHLPDDVVSDSRDERTLDQVCTEILSFYGPLQAPQVQALLPVVPPQFPDGSQGFVTGELVADSSEVWFCEAENYEILLRMQRARHRVDVTPEPIQKLPLFMAAWQGFDNPNNENNQLWVLESLRGYSAGVLTWWFDLLAPRLMGYAASGQTLEDLRTQLGLAWLGTGQEQITLAYPEELELLASAPETSELQAGFTDPKAAYGFSQVADNLGLSFAELNKLWWPGVWRGELLCDDLAPLKQARERRFEMTQATPHTSRRRLARTMAGWGGAWRLHQPQPPQDTLSQLEQDKERVRLLLDRYGFVCRELVNREGIAHHEGDWRWRQAFRALRLMELSGEVLTGLFFSHLSTPQFMTPRGLALFQQGQTQPSAGHQTSFWINAWDPASPCGLGAQANQQWPELPQRRDRNYLSFLHGELALVVENAGQDLTFHMEVDANLAHKEMSEVLRPIIHLVQIRRQTVTLRTINDSPATQSPWLEVLGEHLELFRDHKSVTLQPKF